MPETVLITGGAGFIGRRLSHALVEEGRRVRVLDALIPQAHPSGAPSDLTAEARLTVADIRDKAALLKTLKGVDAVVHLAAEVGVGQSMYAIERYVGVNDAGTAALFQALIERPVRRVVVASSMSVYGEGLYRDADGRFVETAARGAPGEPLDPVDERGRPLSPVPTPEWKRPSLASVYALTKYVQERLTLTVCPAYGMEGVALRFFNVYGPGQALSNPYTGVLAIFASRVLNGQAPLVFEDGRQQRDFVHVDDAVAALKLALDRPEAAGGVFNIGSGAARPVADVARTVARSMGREDLEPEIVGRRRAGDVRHCFADIAAARTTLGFAPRVSLDDGLSDLAAWVSRQEAEDRVLEARRELESRGLVA